MNPDAYLPFYGDKFLTAMRGRPGFVERAYVRVLWYYWSHNHCQGLQNDQEYLRGICESTADDWPIVFSILFSGTGEYFTLCEGDVWHQMRMVKEWQKSYEAYQSSVIRGKKGGPSKWKRNSSATSSANTPTNS